MEVKLERWTAAEMIREVGVRWGRGWRAALVGGVLALALVLALDGLYFTPIDWRLYEEVLAHPLDAYQYDYFNPPWTVWLLWPLRWLPYQAGLVRLLTLTTFLVVARKRGGDGFSLALLATSTPLLYLVANGNIDFLPALGFLVGPAWGLSLLLVKPQTGVFAGLAWLRRAGDWRGAARLLLPTLGLFLLSLLVYGWWPVLSLRNIARMEAMGLPRVTWNTSIFPWGVPLGIYFGWRAWKEADEFHGVTASWLLSPYTPLYSLTLWYALFLGRARRWQAALAWLIFWLVYAWHYLGFGTWFLNRISL